MVVTTVQLFEAQNEWKAFKQLFHDLIYKYSRRRRQWHPTPVLLPGKSHGRRSLEGCSPWGRWGLDTTERLHFHAVGKEMAAHSSVLAWRVPGAAEPGGLLSMGLHRVGHDCSDLAGMSKFCSVKASTSLQLSAPLLSMVFLCEYFYTIREVSLDFWFTGSFFILKECWILSRFSAAPISMAI